MKEFDQLTDQSQITTKSISETKELKPETFYLGEQFENFVLDRLFPENLYSIVRRTDTYERNLNRFSESTLDPDFCFRCRETGGKFAVEAKYRTRLNHKGELSWCKEYQKKRYDLFDSEIIPVFIVVGLGGTSREPERVFLFPIRDVKYINLYMSIAQKYELDLEQLEGVKHDLLCKLLGVDALPLKDIAKSL